ncbi:MAG: hypothetical protein ACRC4L_02250, partial [Mycoplasma sp.]
MINDNSNLNIKILIQDKEEFYDFLFKNIQNVVSDIFLIFKFTPNSKDELIDKLLTCIEKIDLELESKKE